MRTEFESKPTYGYNNNKHIKTKVKIYEGSMITNFHNKKYQKKKYHVNVYQ